MPRILVVDDARFIRVLLKEILEEKGYQVAGEAADGDEAVNKYQELKPDLVIMDVALPTMDGISATQRIRTLDPAAKVIMISAYGTRHKVVKAIQAGAMDFIVKPFETERILASVNKIFDQEQ